MTIRQTIQKKLKAYEVSAIQTLKENNSFLYSIEYKLDLSFFKFQNNKINHLLYWDKDELVGYAAMSNFDPEALEVTLIVRPDQKILNEMNKTIRTFSQQEKINKILLITDRKDTFFRSYMEGINQYKYVFSEYSMILVINQFEPKSTNVSLEPAKKEEAGMIASLEENQLANETMPLDPEDLEKTLVLRKNEQVIASIRVENEGNSSGLYGFVVRSEFRNQGIGRKVISQTIQELLEKQAKNIYLEVESTNETALHLYRSIGFTEQTLFDYYIYEITD
ncbi:GNAT family N-acetyltransferase [Enterococcus sp. AZ101]|uniref:GNAT family N-acetyltransferase n=1 Tax=Enterococcus sp. AZ101 TaxID=2774742 RepID=UPI003D275FDD